MKFRRVGDWYLNMEYVCYVKTVPNDHVEVFFVDPKKAKPAYDWITFKRGEAEPLLRWLERNSERPL